MVKREKHLHIRLNEHEFETISKFAEKMDMKKSEVGRMAIKEYIMNLENPLPKPAIDIDKIVEKIKNGISETKELKTRIVDQQIKHEKFQEKVLDVVDDKLNNYAESVKGALILMKLRNPISLDKLKELTCWNENQIGALLEKGFLLYDHETDKFKLNKERLKSNGK